MPGVGDTILQAAQAINQQLQSQNQLALQQARFAQQAQAAEESVRLREENLSLQQKKIETESAIAQQQLELSQAAGVRSDKAVAVQEGQLDLRVKQFNEFGKQAGLLANALTQSQTALNNFKASGAGTGTSTRGGLTMNQKITRIRDSAQTIIGSTPAFRQAAGVSPEDDAEFGGFSVTSLEKQIKDKRSAASNLRRSTALLTDSSPNEIVRGFLQKANDAENEVLRLEKYRDKIVQFADQAIGGGGSSEAHQALLEQSRTALNSILGGAEGAREIFNEVQKTMNDGGVITKMDAITALLPQGVRNPTNIGLLETAFLSDFSDPNVVTATAQTLDQLLPKTNSAEEFRTQILPNVRALVESLDVTVPLPEVQKVLNQLARIRQPTTPEVAR